MKRIVFYLVFFTVAGFALYYYWSYIWDRIFNDILLKI